jgi:tight adherence protein C
MNLVSLISSLYLAGPIILWSAAFGLLLGMAVLLIWMAFAPPAPRQAVQTRVGQYLTTESRVAQDDVMNQPFLVRAILPALRKILRALGRLLPDRSVDKTRQMLIYAGEPGGITPLDFYGLRLLLPLFLAAAYYVIVGRHQAFPIAARGLLLGGAIGFLAPRFWLRRAVSQRQHRIARALPDALDMMTIGVEAGLAFESAMLKVGDQWNNALTQELRRTVGEMRVGTARDVALKRLAERTGVEDLNTFVAVLIQSTQLGVTIAQVLHAQAAEMRLRRRQRAEELARQASVKMVFPLIFCIFPAMLVVMLGPSLPTLQQFFATMRAGLAAVPTTR